MAVALATTSVLLVLFAGIFFVLVARDRRSSAVSAFVHPSPSASSFGLTEVSLLPYAHVAGEEEREIEREVVREREQEEGGTRPHIVPLLEESA